MKPSMNTNETHTENILALLKHVFESQEDEKEIFYNKLNITTLSSLNKLKCDLNAHLENGINSQDLNESIASVSSSIDTISSSLKNAMLHMYPTIIKSFGLTTSIERLVTQIIETHKIAIRFSHNLNDKKTFIPMNLQFHIFRTCELIFKYLLETSNPNEILLFIDISQENLVLKFEIDNCIPGLSQLPLKKENNAVFMLLEARLAVIHAKIIANTNWYNAISINVPLK